MLGHATSKCDTNQELGVIGAYLESFGAYLTTCGYAPATIRSQLKLLGRFNEWLIRHRSDIHQLNEELVATFLKQRTRRGLVHRGDPHRLRQFLIHRTHGVLSPLAAVVDDSPLGQLQREYAQYLTGERGLAPVTVSGYVDVAVAITAAIASPVGLAQSRANVANDRGSSIRRLERDSRWQADAVWHPPARFSSEVGITPAHGRLNSARGPAMPANRLAPSFRRIVDGAAFN